MSRNQVSPSPSDIELNRVGVGSGQVSPIQQPESTDHGSKSSPNNNFGTENQSHFRGTSPAGDDGQIRPISPERSSLSRLSLKSDNGAARKTPDITVNQQAYTDETHLTQPSIDIDQHEEHYDSDSVALDDHLVDQNIEDAQSLDNNYTKEGGEELYIREGATSRFVKDENEGLVYEPGLPTSLPTTDSLNPVQYAAEDERANNDEYTPSLDEFVHERSIDKGTGTSSVGYARSAVNDGQPQVFNKEPTVFTGTAGGPPIQSVAPNQVRPVDERTYRMAENRQDGRSELERKKSFVIGANENTDGAGCCGWLLYIFSILLIIVTLPFSLIFTIKVVQEYERAVIFRLGRLPMGGASGPGIFFIIPCIESYTKVDLRTVSFDVPPQEVLTKDSVTVSVDAVVYYRVSNPTVSVANVENAHHSTRLLAQTTLRNILGTKDMTDLLADRETISQGMQTTLDEATDRWGIKVERVEIKDVRLPVQLQRAMAAEAEATREARAKVIAAEGEQKAARSLKEASEIMSTSGAALQLRYLQTLNSISAEKNSTIIFPLPLDMMQAFMKK